MASQKAPTSLNAETTTTFSLPKEAPRPVTKNGFFEVAKVHMALGRAKVSRFGTMDPRKKSRGPVMPMCLKMGTGSGGLYFWEFDQ